MARGHLGSSFAAAAAGAGGQGCRRGDLQRPAERAASPGCNASPAPGCCGRNKKTTVCRSAAFSGTANRERLGLRPRPSSINGARRTRGEDQLTQRLRCCASTAHRRRRQGQHVAPREPNRRSVPPPDILISASPATGHTCRTIRRQPAPASAGRAAALMKPAPAGDHGVDDSTSPPGFAAALVRASMTWGARPGGLQSAFTLCAPGSGRRFHPTCGPSKPRPADKPGFRRRPQTCRAGAGRWTTCRIPTHFILDLGLANEVLHECRQAVNRMVSERRLMRKAFNFCAAAQNSPRKSSAPSVVLVGAERNFRPCST